MDPISQNNPTNNPRLDLLHSSGDNQQLGGAAGTYGPTAPGDTSAGGVAPPPPPPPRPQPVAPRAQPQPSAAPQSASSYIGAAQARRPQAASQLPPPPPEPRAAASVPMYTSGVGAGGGDEGGGIGVGGIIVGVVILLLVLGGMYFMFSSQVNNQNKQIQSALNQIKNNSNNNNSGGSLGDVTTSSIGNSGDLKTQTLEVTGASDPTQTSMTVNGSSEFQGPVKFDQDITTGGNITASGTITATGFVGDGSQLTGLPSAGVGAAGASGPQGATGATGPEGAPNPDAIDSNHATTSTSCTTCVTLQGASPGTADVGNLNITGTGIFGGDLQQKTGLAAPTNLNLTGIGGGSVNNGTYYAVVVAVNGSTLSAPSAEETCVLSQGGGHGSCSISWTASSFATSYRIYVGTSGGGENEYFTSNTNSYDLSDLGSGNTSGVPPSAGSGSVAYNDFSASSSYTLGSFGIGTSTPSTALQVVGTASATGLTVGSSGQLTVDGTGNLSTSGSITGGQVNASSLGVGNNGGVAAAIIGSDGSISGTSLNAGSGTIQTTGTVQGGAIAGGSLNVGGTTIDGSGNVTLPNNGTSITADNFNGYGGYVNNGEFCLSGCVGGVTLNDVSSQLRVNTVVAATGFAFNNTAGSTQSCVTAGTAMNITAVEGGIVTGISSSPCGTQNSDYAEKYNSTQSLSPGEVVVIDPNNAQGVIASTQPNQSTAIGVVSTQPGYTIGSGNTIVAEAGHIPVDVTGENGPIAPGDYLTPSSTPGYAMKASPGDKTIAQAMEGFSGASGQVDAFIEISNGGAVTTTTPATDPTQTQSQTQPTQGDAAGTFTDLNASGNATLNNLTVTGTATLASLTVTGTTTVADLVVNGHIVGNADTRGNVTVPAGATTFTHAFTSAYATEPTVVASPDTSAVSYFVTATTTGFTITLSAPAAADQTFSYLVQQ